MKQFFQKQAPVKAGSDMSGKMRWNRSIKQL